MTDRPNFEIFAMISLFITVFLVLSNTLIGSRVKIGPFEFGKSKDKLDKQIDEIANLVDKQNQEKKKIVLKEFSDVLKQTTALGPKPSLDYQTLADKIDEIVDSNKQKKEDPTWSLVEGLINSYHKQALKQASIQFWFSIGAAVVGFVIVLYTFFFSSFKSPGDMAITALPGIVIDLVAALFFRQAEQTRQRATELYDRLRNDNKRTIAIELIESIDNEDLKSVVKAQLALKMGGVETTVQELSTLSSQGTAAQH